MKPILKRIFFAAATLAVASPVLADDNAMNTQNTDAGYSDQNTSEGMNRQGLAGGQTSSNMAFDADHNDSAQTQPNNTAMNARDRDPNSITPLDHGSSNVDTNTTATIRKNVMALRGISVDAQNVKIITQNGKVTLRGPVKTAEEKRLINEIASSQVRPQNVNDQLEVVR